MLFFHSHKVISRALKAEEILGGVALLIFGPAALTAYLLRARHVWVSVDQIRGVVVGGRRVIPWEDIRIVERRRPSFRRTAGPTEVQPLYTDVPELAANIGCDGCVSALGEAFVVAFLILAAPVAFWLIIVVIVPLIVIPVVEVFAPFGDRFRIITRKGTLVPARPAGRRRVHAANRAACESRRALNLDSRSRILTMGGLIGGF